MILLSEARQQPVANSQPHKIIYAIYLINNEHIKNSTDSTIL